MIERGGVLLAWQLLSDPVTASGLPSSRPVWPITAKRIADHRLAYLTYEGPISGDRGRVRRLDAGTVVFDEIAPDRVAIALDGSQIRGGFVLEQAGESWTLSCT